MEGFIQASLGTLKLLLASQEELKNRQARLEESIQQVMRELASGLYSVVSAAKTVDGDTSMETN